MEDILDIETVAEIEVEVENEVDVDIEIEQAGPQGKDGKSAYEIYIDNGGELSETEWLESLKGPEGPEGPAGPRGEKGDIGDTGYTLTNTVRGESVTIEDAVEYKLLNLEIDGKSEQNGEPTPDTAIEIESLGYENLFDKDNLTNGYRLDSAGQPYSDSGYSLTDYIKVQPNTSYTRNVEFLWNTPICLYKEDKTFISRIQVGNTITTTEETYYIRTNVLTSDINIAQLEKGLISHSYISYGKAGIEVKTVGKNLFNKSEVKIGKSWHGGSSTNRGSLVLEYEPNKDYAISLLNFDNLSSVAIVEATEIAGTGSVYTKTFSEAFTFTHTMSANAKYLCIQIESTTTFTEEILENIKIQLEKEVATEYEDYKSNTTVLTLNEPLRSLPNGVKDKAYIKNNKLYVDRYVGNYNYSENDSFTLTTNSSTGDTFFKNTTISNKIKKWGTGISSHFIFNDKAYNTPSISDAIFVGGGGYDIYFKIKNITTIEDFKTWLSSNDVQVDYVLATPVTEEVGDCVIYTYAGVNNIDLVANLKTEFSVTYAQDMKSILKDYPSMEELKAYVDSQLGTINEQLASLTEVE